MTMSRFGGEHHVALLAKANILFPEVMEHMPVKPLMFFVEGPSNVEDDSEVMGMEGDEMDDSVEGNHSVKVEASPRGGARSGEDGGVEVAAAVSPNASDSKQQT